MPTPPECPYCQSPSKLVNGDAIYPHRPDLYEKKFWACDPCKAYVGCHQGTETPLGRLANSELRSAKMAAHAALDPIWKSGKMKRGAVYVWLAEKMGIPIDQCHIGMFDVDQCKKVREICLQEHASDDCTG